MADELSIRISLAYASGGETRYSKNVAITQNKTATTYGSGTVTVTPGSTTTLLALSAGNPQYVLIRNLSPESGVDTDYKGVLHVHTTSTVDDGIYRMASLPPEGVCLFPVGVENLGDSATVYVQGENIAGTTGTAVTSIDVEYTLLTP